MSIRVSKVGLLIPVYMLPIGCDLAPDEASERATTDTTAAQALSADGSPPTIDSITAPSDPVAVSQPIIVAVEFSDPDAADTHSARIEWGDGASSVASVDQEDDTFSASHTYALDGIYAVEVSVSDGAHTTSERHEYVTVYNPDGEYVTGSGAIASPPGACTWSGCAADGSTVGEATFGIFSRYQKGASTPSGNTRFRFRAGDLSFVSTAYQWLVVGGARAQYKGRGQINQQGDYGVLVTAVDGDLVGSGGDGVRVKIWDRATGDVVYDNQRGAGDQSDATTALSRGRITIRTAGRNTEPAVVITSPADGALRQQADSVVLEAFADDLEDGDVSGSLTWESSLDGSLGAGPSISAVLSPGQHVVTATATDSRDLTGSASVELTVNAAPAVAITSPPDDGAIFDEGLLLFEGSATDPEDGELAGESLVWSSDVDGVLGSGASLTARLSIGTHLVELAATDSDGGSASATVTVTVENVAPVVTITSPADGASFDSGADVDLEAIATDAGEDISAAVQWSSSLDGSLGAGGSLTTTLSDGTHALSASVDDPDDAAVSTSATVEVTVGSAGGSGGPFIAVAPGRDSACALVPSGEAYCWGSNATGALGVSDTSEACGLPSHCPTPVAVSGGHTFTGLGGTSDFFCGLDPFDEVWCWGNTAGYMAGSEDPNSHLPVPLAPPEGESAALIVREMSVGLVHRCVVTEDDDAYCWGANNEGQLGFRDFDVPESYTPVLVPGDLSFVTVAADGNHSCGLTQTGRAHCWGRNDRGQLGVGDTLAHDGPVEVVPPAGFADPLAFEDIALGTNHTCARTAEGDVYCWGRNSDGELGLGESDFDPHYVPELVSGDHTFATISAAGEATCGVDSAGDAWCWGQNRSSGQIGDGTFVDRASPTLVSGGHDWFTVHAGIRLSCGLDTDDHAWCWGRGDDGQLGNGDTEWSTEPVRVVAP